jgi:hypothetical protein
MLCVIWLAAKNGYFASFGEISSTGGELPRVDFLFLPGFVGQRPPPRNPRLHSHCRRQKQFDALRTHVRFPRAFRREDGATRQVALRGARTHHSFGGVENRARPEACRREDHLLFRPGNRGSLRGAR